MKVAPWDKTLHSKLEGLGSNPTMRLSGSGPSLVSILPVNFGSNSQLKLSASIRLERLPLWPKFGIGAVNKR